MDRCSRWQTLAKRIKEEEIPLSLKRHLIEEIEEEMEEEGCNCGSICNSVINVTQLACNLGSALSTPPLSFLGAVCPLINRRTGAEMKKIVFSRNAPSEPKLIENSCTYKYSKNRIPTILNRTDEWVPYSDSLECSNRVNSCRRRELLGYTRLEFKDLQCQNDIYWKFKKDAHL
jgi:hypothetical protein